jgi:hypothetical protein
VLTLAPAAGAVPPPYDDFDNATVITALPFFDSADTSEATVAADDPASACVFSPPLFTIWYAFTPSADMRLVTGSNTQPVAVSVFVGSRGALSEVGCGFDQFSFDALVGTTYYFMVSTSASFGAVGFFLQEVIPVPSVTLAVDSRGSVNTKTGVATVRGTVTCSSATVLPFISVDLSQLFARRVTISGGGSTADVPCSPSGTAWSVVVQGSNGRFGAGAATATARTTVCNAVGACSDAEATKSIRLRG